MASGNKKQKTKAMLEKENEALQEKIASLSDMQNQLTVLAEENKALSKKIKADTSVQDQLNQLVEENKALRARSKSAENKERFVGIRSTTLGRVWLPAPESGSGMPQDTNRGVMLKPGKTAVVPSYWMAYYIANKSNSFLGGNVVIDNEAGKFINPGVEFVEMELPEDFVSAAMMPSELEKIFKTGSTEKVIDYIDSIGDNKHALYKVFSYAKGLEGTYHGKHKAFIDTIILYLDDLIHPEKKDK